MRIGELAELAGVSTRSLRYYEAQGLLRARRAANGYREYGDEDLRMVREIRSLLELGFGLEETRPIVECPIPRWNSRSPATKSSTEGLGPSAFNW
ncbi:MerR family transcriptional regulator, partial [Streptomyces decoyicus]|uniref:MerR family transcriptional regulator n=1 Tax=Streptomyces decoyicus TaxID=249567 RepID=UPI0033AAA702